MNKLITFAFFFFLVLNTRAQSGKIIDRNINEGKGTMVIRKIEKNNSTPKNSGKIIARVFRPFSHQLLAGPMPYNVLIIDTTGHSIDSNGYIIVSLSPGKHKISIVGQPDLKGTFYSFRDTWMKFKKKRTYYVDFYVWPPVAADHH